MKGFIVKNEIGEVINFETEEVATPEELELAMYIFGTSVKNQIIFHEKYEAEGAITKFVKPLTKMATSHPLPKMSIVEVEVKIVMQEV